MELINITPYEAVNDLRFGMSYQSVRARLNEGFKTNYYYQADIPQVDYTEDIRLFYSKNGEFECLSYLGESLLAINGGCIDVAEALLRVSRDSLASLPKGFDLYREESTYEAYSIEYGATVIIDVDDKGAIAGATTIAFAKGSYWHRRCLLLNILLKHPSDSRFFMEALDYLDHGELELSYEWACDHFIEECIFMDKDDYVELVAIGEAEMVETSTCVMIPIDDAYPAEWEKEEIAAAEMEVATSPSSKSVGSIYRDRECYIGTYDGLEIAVTTDGNEVLWSRPVMITGYEKPFFDSL